MKAAAGNINKLIGVSDDDQAKTTLLTTIKSIQTTSDSINDMFQRDKDKQPNFADAIANFDNLLGANGEKPITFRSTLKRIDESIKVTSKSIKDASDVARKHTGALRRSSRRMEWGG